MNDELSRTLSAAHGWHVAGHGVALATVIHTWGSSPRPVGSHMAVRDDGAFEGSVSSGCVEGDVIAEALDVIRTGRFRQLDYGVDDETAWRVGLPCGGRISVIVQPVGQDGFPADLLAEVNDARGQRRRITLSTDLDGGRTRAGTADGLFCRRYDPPPRLIIIGAVNIAQALLPMARLAGHETILIDPRDAFGSTVRFPGESVDNRWPDEVLAETGVDEATAIVTLTHDMKIDDPALVCALRSSAYYIGALGSRRTQAARRARLAEAGFTPEDMGRIHGPVGLDIGGITPAEIAISILAEMTAAWRGRLPLIARQQETAPASAAA